MSFKKRVSKSIALALIGIMVSGPISNISMAMENEDSFDEIQIEGENDKLRATTLGLDIPKTAIAPGVFISVGLVGYTIMHIYKASKGTAKEVDNTWDKIPNKLKDPDGSVGIKKFSTKLSKGVRKDPKTGWTLEPDKAGHKGSKWKLKDKKGNRIGSLDSEGRVVGK